MALIVTSSFFFGGKVCIVFIIVHHILIIWMAKLMSRQALSRFSFYYYNIQFSILFFELNFSLWCHSWNNTLSLWLEKSATEQQQ